MADLGALLARMSRRDKLDQLQIVWRRDLARRGGVGQARHRRAVLARERGRHEPSAAHRPRRESTRHPAADRPGRHPRAPHDVPDPARRSGVVRPAGRVRRRRALRGGGGERRRELDVLADDRRRTRSSLGSGRRGVRRGSGRRRAHGRREDPRLPGRTPRRPDLDRRDGEALRRVRRCGRRPGLQHGRHVGAAPPQRLPAAVRGRGPCRGRERDGVLQHPVRGADAWESAHAHRAPRRGVGASGASSSATPTVSSNSPVTVSPAMRATPSGSR